MHTLHILLTALLTALMAQCRVFKGQCDTARASFHIDGSAAQNPFYRIDCVGHRGPAVCSQINLNSCFGYADGKVVPQEGGNFSTNCRGCSLVEDTKLQCTCSGGKRTNYQITFDLFDTLDNSGGYLTCFDQPEQGCPQEL